MCAHLFGLVVLFLGSSSSLWSGSISKANPHICVFCPICKNLAFFFIATCLLLSSERLFTWTGSLTHYLASTPAGIINCDRRPYNQDWEENICLRWRFVLLFLCPLRIIHMCSNQNSWALALQIVDAGMGVGQDRGMLQKHGSRTHTNLQL